MPVGDALWLAVVTAGNSSRCELCFRLTMLENELFERELAEEAVFRALRARLGDRAPEAFNRLMAHPSSTRTVLRQIPIVLVRLAQAQAQLDAPQPPCSACIDPVLTARSPVELLGFLADQAQLLRELLAGGTTDPGRQARTTDG
jgi:hypothetical protein